jgi:hypothetical protein
MIRHTLIIILKKLEVMMKNNYLRETLILLALGFFVFCNPQENTIDQIQEKDTRQSIKEKIGEPVNIAFIKKTTDIIWGPEEAFWDQIELGERVEVWSYAMGKNQFKIYFRENSDGLLYKAIIDPSTVYESDNPTTH